MLFDLALYKVTTRRYLTKSVVGLLSLGKTSDSLHFIRLSLLMLLSKVELSALRLWRGQSRLEPLCMSLAQIFL